MTSPQDRKRPGLEVRRRRASARPEREPERHEPPRPAPSRKAEARTGERRRRVGARPGRIRTGHEDRYVGESPMACLGRKLIGARSLLALDFLTVTDAFSRDVADMTDQPEPLEIGHRGETRAWFPDYMIARESGRRELVIVRTVGWLTGRDASYGAWMRDLVDAMEEAAHRAGFGFRLVTEEQIRVQPRLANAKMLLRHLDPYRPRRDDVAAIDALAGIPDESSVSELQERLGRRLDAFPLALRLDWLGHLRMDRRTWFRRKSGFTKT
ncbi:hypothetical protein [Microvirga massiliensis]|uniref:hypothetical protein n=1 Tax=Microvirga massiliensis TaxID=1033741 RepID=UPI00062B69BF|nr:hypothetical protein [Microvirga massiliensis]